MASDFSTLHLLCRSNPEYINRGSIPSDCPIHIKANIKERTLTMIDFKNASFLKLKPVSNSNFSDMVSPLFIESEKIIYTFQSIRDGVVFTNKRIIAINIQGVTGKKKDFTSLPYSKIQSFSVETAGMFDLDCELDLWFSGLGVVRFEFVSNADVSAICRVISNFVL